MPEDAAIPERNGAPLWAMEPFKKFVDNSERLANLLHLCASGISVLRGMPRIVEVIEKIEQGDPQQAARKLESAKKQADLAQREVDEGFPLLRAQTVISLWTALEATIRTFLARWLENNEQAFAVDPVQTLRVKIGEYEKLQGQDRYFYIVDRLEQETSAPLKLGITRFEVLLKPFGLSEAVSDEDRRNLFELNHVRNALVHRSGVTDRRLTDACPWLGLSPGQALRLDDAMMSRYFHSSMQYTTDIVVRLGEYFGVDMKEFESRPRAPSTEGYQPLPADGQEAARGSPPALGATLKIRSMLQRVYSIFTSA